jgi:hypothetical protein
VVQIRRVRTFFWSSEKKLYIAALSPAKATRPIDPVSPFAVNTALKARDRNCDLLPERTAPVPLGVHRAIANRSAETASSAVVRSASG